MFNNFMSRCRCIFGNSSNVTLTDATFQSVPLSFRLEDCARDISGLESVALLTIHSHEIELHTIVAHYVEVVWTHT